MIGPPPSTLPACRRCRACGYVYEIRKLDKRGEQFFCKDAKGCAARILKKKRERELQRSWSR